MFGMFLTRTRSPTLKRVAAWDALGASLFAFMTRPHLRNLLQEFVQRDVLLVDEHLGRRPNPTPVVRHPKIEGIAEIVVGPAAPLFSRPRPPPTEHFAGHVSLEFPLFFFFFLVVDRDIRLTSDIMRGMHKRLEQQMCILVVPILRHMKRRLERRYEVVLLTKLRS